MHRYIYKHRYAYTQHDSRWYLCEFTGYESESGKGSLVQEQPELDGVHTKASMSSIDRPGQWHSCQMDWFPWENREKLWPFLWNMGFPVNFPWNQSISLLKFGLRLPKKWPGKRICADGENWRNLANPSLAALNIGKVCQTSLATKTVGYVRSLESAGPTGSVGSVDHDQ